MLMGATIMFSTLGYTILMLWISKKSFRFHHFLIIKVYLWNKTNMDTHNILHSFFYLHYNHVLHIGIHDIKALNLQEKLFFPPFSLQLMFIRELRQTWILVIIFILFLIGTTIMFSSLGAMILMLWICKKSFSFHHFP